MRQIGPGVGSLLQMRDSDSDTGSTPLVCTPGEFSGIWKLNSLEEAQLVFSFFDTNAIFHQQ